MVKTSQAIPIVQNPATLPAFVKVCISFIREKEEENKKKTIN